MKLSERLRAIRVAENLKQREFADAVGIPLDTVKNYELDRRTPGADQLQLITNHPQFTKYTLWLMTETTAPAAGQVSPMIESGSATG